MSSERIPRPEPTAIEDARALVAELREIHARSRDNAREQGWGVPPEGEDHSPWSRAADMIERLTAAYAELKTEYGEYRLDRQDQMTRLRAAIDDAERGARIGNLMTPPWVVQQIADIRAEWQKVTR